MTNLMKLSIVVPIFNEELIVAEFYKRLDDLAIMLNQKFNIKENEVEIIWVNDGSTDSSFSLLKEKCSLKTNYVLVNLSRNYGHQYAITAGLENSAGQFVVVIDGDLQDPPEFIVDLYSKINEGYDVVYAVRKSRRGEGFFKKKTASLFYKLLSRIVSINIPVNVGDYRIISRRVLENFLTMNEMHRYVRGMISWIGFKSIGILYDRDSRYAGETKYSLRKMMHFALDGITSFSSAPLKISLYLGCLVATSGFVYACYIVFIHFFTDKTILGWSSLIIVVLILGGTQLLTIGLIGEYIGRIYEQVKHRPLYIVDEIYGKNQEADSE